MMQRSWLKRNDIRLPLLNSIISGKTTVSTCFFRDIVFRLRLLVNWPYPIYLPCTASSAVAAARPMSDRKQVGKEQADQGQTAGRAASATVQRPVQIFSTIRSPSS